MSIMLVSSVGGYDLLPERFRQALPTYLESGEVVLHCVVGYSPSSVGLFTREAVVVFSAHRSLSMTLSDDGQITPFTVSDRKYSDIKDIHVGERATALGDKFVGMKIDEVIFRFPCTAGAVAHELAEWLRAKVRET